MTDGDLASAADLVEIPEGCIPEFGIIVISYLDVDGESKVGTRVLGDGTYTATAGIMAMAAHSLFHKANPTRCEVDDDDDG